MHIRLRFFASLRDRLGHSESVCEVPEGSTIATVLAVLKEKHPELVAVETSLAFAVEYEYVDKTHVLKEDDELAFIPPVSGGVGTLPDSTVLCKLTADVIQLEELTEFVTDPSAGAIATFVGMTRDNNEGREVVRLEYECYPEMAEKEMKTIGQAIIARWPVKKVALVHRLGKVKIGEASVAIAVSSSHRHASFVGCRYAIDTLKETVPIWKKELYKGGELWIGSQNGKNGTLRQTEEKETRVK